MLVRSHFIYSFSLLCGRLPCWTTRQFVTFLVVTMKSQLAGLSASAVGASVEVTSNDVYVVQLRYFPELTQKHV